MEEHQNTSWHKKPAASSESKHKLPKSQPIPAPALSSTPASPSAPIHSYSKHSHYQTASTIIYISAFFCCFFMPVRAVKSGCIPHLHFRRSKSSCARHHGTFIKTKRGGGRLDARAYCLHVLLPSITPMPTSARSISSWNDVLREGGSLGVCNTLQSQKHCPPQTRYK